MQKKSQSKKKVSGEQHCDVCRGTGWVEVLMPNVLDCSIKRREKSMCSACQPMDLVMDYQDYLLSHNKDISHFEYDQQKDWEDTWK